MTIELRQIKQLVCVKVDELSATKADYGELSADTEDYKSTQYWKCAVCSRTRMLSASLPLSSTQP